MNCCRECFCDSQIRTMVVANNTIGDCDFCKGKNVFVYEVDTVSDLSDIISDVIGVYEEDEDGGPLFSSIINDWHIFNKSMESGYNLLETFCQIIFGSKEKDYDRNVRIPHTFLENYGIFSGHSWSEFSTVIKEKNRFCNSFFRADQFASFLSYSVTRYRKGMKFYRARIWADKRGYSQKEMGAPPKGKRKSGRVNPEGIGVLYLASDEKTALSEVRASAFDLVSVGKFRLAKDMKVINISGLNAISPVVYSSGIESLAANIKVFGDIAQEIAKPLRSNDSSLEYLPTQYITEFIKSKGYSGVEYTSTMGTGGTNIAVFNESLFECIDVHDVEIKKVEYLYEDAVVL